MPTVAILPISDANGEKSYRAILKDKHSVSKTEKILATTLATTQRATRFLTGLS